MKFIPREPVYEIVKEETIGGIIYQGIKYLCPNCMTEVFHYQEKCECGQRLKPYSKSKAMKILGEIWENFQKKTN